MAPLTLVKAMDKAENTAEDFKAVLRCNGIDPTVESLDAVLRKYKILVSAAEIAARAFVSAGVEMPKGQNSHEA
jgi:hypothetical protein